VCTRQVTEPGPKSPKSGCAIVEAIVEAIVDLPVAERCRRNAVAEREIQKY